MTLPARAAQPNSENLRFFEGAEQGLLVLPRCNDCDFVIWFPREICPECGSQDVDWFEASGKGSVYSFTVTRRIPGSWGQATPFGLAYVELEEGPRVMTTSLTAIPNKSLSATRSKQYLKMRQIVTVIADRLCFVFDRWEVRDRGENIVSGR